MIIFKIFKNSCDFFIILVYGVATLCQFNVCLVEVKQVIFTNEYYYITKHIKYLNNFVPGLHLDYQSADHLEF